MNILICLFLHLLIKQIITIHILFPRTAFLHTVQRFHPLFFRGIIKLLCAHLSVLPGIDGHNNATVFTDKKWIHRQCIAPLYFPVLFWQLVSIIHDLRLVIRFQPCSYDMGLTLFAMALFSVISYKLDLLCLQFFPGRADTEPCDVFLIPLYTV